MELYYVREIHLLHFRDKYGVKNNKKTISQIENLVLAIQ
jgi:hypothetical protein